MGHLNIRSLNIMHICNMVHGLPHLKLFLPICENCIFDKLFQFPYPTTLVTKAIIPLTLIHIEICGPWAPLPLMVHYIFRYL